MEHALRAEYAAGPADEGDERGGGGGRGAGGGPERRAVRSWHMVREGHDGLAMCGLALEPGAARRPDEDWGRTAEPMCHTCGALYLREVP
jgi:hypothetical protein